MQQSHIPHKQISSTSSGSGQKKGSAVLVALGALQLIVPLPVEVFFLADVSKAGPYSLGGSDGCSAWHFPHGESVPQEASWRKLHFHGGKQHQEQPEASVQVILPSRFSQIHELDKLEYLELLSQFLFSWGEPWCLIANVTLLLSTQTAPRV